MDKIHDFLKENISTNQIKALLWKDFLVRKRKPWMILLQYIWPCIIFIALYTLRNRFQSTEVQSCQYPTRQLPTKGEILPFFQSYICTIENQCINTTKYEETTIFDKAPITPVLNIIQIFLNERILFDTVIDLPETMNFIGAITAVATHDKFSIIEQNINLLRGSIQDYGSLIGENFDINKLWSDDMTFSKGGNILCGRPFPRSNDIKFVNDLFYKEDYNGPDKAELNVMPTNYCKQLYLDVTNTNRGKITWSEIKPIIHGKILYGPNTEKNKEIMSYANETFQQIHNLRTFIGGLDKIIVMLRTNETFSGKLKDLINLTKSPFLKSIISSFGIDTSMIDQLYETLMHDEVVATIVGKLYNILECFTVDRFVPVENEMELEEMANKLNENKLFFAGIYFNESENNQKHFTYKLRMEIDDTPITIENKNRFWFPGPNDDFDLEMRYHRGFIQIQNAIDQGIIKSERKVLNAQLKMESDKTSTSTTTTTTEESLFNDNYDDDDDDEYTDIDDDVEFGGEKMDVNQNNKIMASTDATNEITTESIIENNTEIDIKTESNNIENTTNMEELDDSLEDFLNWKDENQEENVTQPSTTTTTTTTTKNVPLIAFSNDEIQLKNRTKRAPQFDGILGLLLGTGGGSKKNHEVEEQFNIDQYKVYTKEMPYPKYRKDNFKKGLYLAQSIQLAFFFALIVQVSGAVRQRIWMKESGNIMLMNAMGLKKSSETISWIITTIIELAVIFLLCIIILYTGGILETSNKLFIYSYLMLFGCCTVSFCYMTSTFFTSASTGSVSAVILFLITFMPYIIIIALGASLSFGAKFLANLSISTAFCYSWHFIMRTELQQKELSFTNAFTNSLFENDLKFGMLMLFIDTVIYAIIGYVYERYSNGEYKFYRVNVKDMDSGIGAAMNNVSKSYGEAMPAIKNVSVVFRRDFITCLLGRNGAGKSTMIKLLTGQIQPTTGEVYLAQNLDRISGNETEEKIGLCPQNNVLIPNLTAKEHLQLYARIKMNDGFHMEIERIMNCLNYEKYKNFKSENLSGGYKRRLNIAIAFLGSPNLVILDEPCSGVDTKARKNVWELIEQLRKGRAVVLATHYLDEAEHLSDNIIMLNNGSVVAEHDAASLKKHFSKSFDLHIDLFDTDKIKIVDQIKQLLNEFTPSSYSFVNESSYNKNTFIKITISYSNTNRNFINVSPLIKEIEQLKSDKRIRNFNIIGNGLEEIFNDLNDNNTNNNNGTSSSDVTILDVHPPILESNGNGHVNHYDHSKINNHLHSNEIVKRSKFDIIKNLFWKRYLHFKRNYKLLLCILVLPVIFEIIAMGFMKIRPHGDYDNQLTFSRDLYAGSQEFYSLENEDNATESIYNYIHEHCDQDNCNLFNTSENVFRWILKTHDDYLGRRYGGVSINNTSEYIWYDNNGYHVMPVYLNELNTRIFQTELDDPDCKITTINHPIQFGRVELSTSSILQQVADAGISLIILVAFSLVVAGSSIYLVNERVTGEKLQQMLCGVSFTTYWGVSYVWDLIIYCIAMLFAVIIFQIFAIPIYTAKDNFDGVILLIFLYGFATIPMVHLFEKLFRDSSLANMYIFCMNIIIALITIIIIILFDVLGETDESVERRNMLNRIFLIFPQHALADGLIEICKNHLLAQIFERFYINTYKSPISSDLLKPHFLCLFILGILFIVLNYIIENNYIKLSQLKAVFGKTKKSNELSSIINAEKSNGEIGKNQNHSDANHNDISENVLIVRNLTKKYDDQYYAIKNVSFSLKRGECFGLLGANGAGKSTIFSILSGQLQQTSGTIDYCFNSKNNNAQISYCPQNNALDDLLTVQEIIRFYGILRNIKYIEELTANTLKSFHLEQYKNILVKNLSGGNRRKLSVAITCFGNTHTILMDEPTSDMDPMTRSLVYKAINNLIKQNRSIILTSHTITEIDRVCHRIGVLHDGKIISIGSPHELQIIYGNRYLITIFYEHVDALNIERDLKQEISELENLIVHRHCLQFTIRIKKSSVIDIASNPDGGIHLSNLLNRLHNFTVDRNIIYTITECQLDQAFEKSMESQI